MTALVDEAVVRGLIARQFPQLVGLPLRTVRSAGTDNTLFRLGNEMAVRLPRVGYTADLLRRESEWLPRLAPLPLEIPVVLARGEPDAVFPWPWLVVRWLDGEEADIDRLDEAEAARTLAGFLAVLQAIPSGGGPTAGPQNLGRGGPLMMRDARTRMNIAAIADAFDAHALLHAWERALTAPAHDGPGVWVHGDLHAANLLQRRGQLTGVIDFGLLGVGDPAADLAVAWNFLPSAARIVFRDSLRPSLDLWARARGWALSVAVSQQAHYRTTNPYLAAMSERTIAAVLADTHG